MATITIGPTGDYRHPTAEAYDALSGGGAANTVQFQGGYSYVPDPVTGKWWGRDQRDGLDKRIEAVITGTGPAILTGLLYVTTGMTATYTGSNIWRIDLLTNANASALDDSDEVFFGALYDDATSGVEIGWRRPPATSLANVGADGLTSDGMLAGKGVWYSSKSGSTVRLYVWCPDGGASRPEVQWGGIAVGLLVSGSGAVGTTPKTHAFVFKGTSGNDPSGSTVEGDFRLIGAWDSLVGSPTASRSDAYSTISDIVYRGITMYGRGKVRLESSTSGTTLSGVQLRDGWLHDDRIDPAVYQVIEGLGGKFETVAVEFRVRDMVLADGTIIVGISHGALSLVPLSGGTFNGSGSEESRTSGCVVRGMRLMARAGTDVYARAFAVRAMYDTTIENCSMTGFSVPSKINGARTKILRNHYSLSNGCLPAIDANAGEEIFSVTTVGGATEDASLSCEVHGNTIDRRGDAGRGVTDPWAAIVLKAQTDDDIPAGAIDMQGNTFLFDGGSSTCVRAKSYTGGTVSANQTSKGNRTNASTECSEALPGVSNIGTNKTFEELFSAGTVSGNITDTAANLLARGDLPTPALSIGLPA